jgi:hypothetical protein
MYESEKDVRQMSVFYTDDVKTYETNLGFRSLGGSVGPSADQDGGTFVLESDLVEAGDTVVTAVLTGLDVKTVVSTASEPRPGGVLVVVVGCSF